MGSELPEIRAEQIGERGMALALVRLGPGHPDRDRAERAVLERVDRGPADRARVAPAAVPAPARQDPEAAAQARAPAWVQDQDREAVANNGPHSHCLMEARGC